MKLKITETLAPGHATEPARDVARPGQRMVVAAGGNGTFGEVTAGLDSSLTPMGIIPLGTANVLAHALGPPFAPQAVAAILAFGRTRALWPGIDPAGRGPAVVRDAAAPIQVVTG